MQIPTVVYFLIWAALFALIGFGCGAHVMGHRHRQDESAGKSGPTPGDKPGGPPERDADLVSA